MPETLQDKEVGVCQTGRWWIVDLEDPCIAAQGESKMEALDKLASRLDEYQQRRNASGDIEDIRMPDIDDPRDDRDFVDPSRYFERYESNHE